MEPMRNPLDEQVCAMLERIGEEWDVYGLDPKPQPVEHESRDGFIPFTNGGYRLMVMDDLGQCAGSGNTPALIQPYIDSAQKDAAADFIRNEDLSAAFEASAIEDPGAWLFKRWDDAEDAHVATVPLFPELPKVDFWQTPMGREREQFYEYETQYLAEGGEFWYEARAHYYAAGNYRNKSGADEIWFCAGINTDFTYGRDKGLDVLWERNVPLSELTPELLEDIETAMLKAVGDA